MAFAHEMLRLMKEFSMPYIFTSSTSANILALNENIRTVKSYKNIRFFSILTQKMNSPVVDLP